MNILFLHHIILLWTVIIGPIGLCDYSNYTQAAIANGTEPVQQQESSFVATKDARQERQEDFDVQDGGEDLLPTPLKDVVVVASFSSGSNETCIEKVTLVDEVVYEDFVECHHRYDELCHVTYATTFESQQEERCQENYKKSCYIYFKKVIREEEFEFCHTPYLCEGEGPTECQIVYETECETTYHEHEVEEDTPECQTVKEEHCQNVSEGYATKEQCRKWPKQSCTTVRHKVKKYNPETKCRKNPRKLCGPSGCKLTPGLEECFPRKKNVIVEIPEETCELEADKSCEHVTTLVPSLKSVNQCLTTPFEVCVHSKRNPKTVQKPVIKKWCYNSSNNRTELPINF